MRRIIRPLLLVAALAALLSVSAFAADKPTVECIYGVAPEDNVTLTLDGKEVTKATANPETTYAVQKFDSVSLSGASDGEYLILVLSNEDAPTKDNIMYINQATAGDSSVTFENVYPKQMADRSYNVYITGTDRAFTATDNKARAATFQYNVPYVKGDVDGKAGISANDALYILQAVAQVRTLEGSAALAADVDGKSGISANDALYVLQAVAQVRTL